MFLKLSFKKERSLKHGLNEITNSVPYLQYFIKCLGLKHPILLNLQMSSGTPLTLSLTDKDSELSSQILQINCKNLSDSNSLSMLIYRK